MKKDAAAKRLIEDFRKMLMAIAKPKLENVREQDVAAKKLGTVRGTIRGMLYSGTGGMEPWIVLLSHLYKIKPGQFESLLVEIKQLFEKKRKLTKGEILWANTGDELNEDEKHFWAGIIQGVKSFTPGFLVRRKKK